MATLRILVYRGKHMSQYWLANTPTRAAQARETLFRQLDDDGCYEGEKDQKLLELSREGNINCIAVLLETRRHCEYETWDYKYVEVLDSDDVPIVANLLDFNAYQKAAHATAIYPSDAGILYAALGLTGESGEVANQVKKVLRDDKNVLTDERKQAIAKELGGVLWYVAEVASVMGIDLAAIAALNLAQLHSRKKRGTIKGDGDNR